MKLLPSRRTAATFIALLASALAPPVLSAQDGFEELLATGKEEFRAYEARTRLADDTTGAMTDLHAAIAALERAVAVRPESQEAHYFLGYAYDRFYSGNSPGSALPAMTLVPTRKISAEFEKVIAIAPKYEGEIITLSPYSKLSSTWGSLAMAYAARGERDSALLAFREGRRLGGFPDHALEFCRNIMRSCDTGAIVIVNGDNDTFPMWYLQMAEGFRRDITVVNLSLANTAWYRLQLRNGYPFGPNSLSFTLGDQELRDLVGLILKKPTQVRIPLPQSARKSFEALLGERLKAKEMAWSAPGHQTDDGRHYLMEQDLAFIDLLKGNAWRRPVYFSTSVDNEAIGAIGLNDFFRMEGMAWRITPHRSAAGTGSFDYGRIASMLLDQGSGFGWESWRRDAVYNDPDVSVSALAYGSLFLIAADHYTDVGEKERALALLGRMEEVLPKDRLPEVYRKEVEDWMTNVYRKNGVNRVDEPAPPERLRESR